MFSSMAFDDVHLDSTQPSSNNNEENDGYKSPSDALSILSIDTNSGHEDSVTKLTPMKNSEIGALIPLGLHGNSHDECDVMSEDSMSIKSFGDDQDYASALSSITATPQPPPVPPPPFHQNHVQHPVPVYYRQSSAVSSVASAHNRYVYINQCNFSNSTGSNSQISRLLFLSRFTYEYITVKVINILIFMKLKDNHFIL